MKRQDSAPKVAQKKHDTTGVLPPLVSLKCHICEEYLNEAVTLPCLHSFCRSCLEKYNAQKVTADSQTVQTEEKRGEEFEFPKESKETDPDTRKDEFLTVQCPTCIDILGLTPPQEPQVPFENSRLDRIVNMVRESNVLCQNCHEAQSEVKCKKCDAWLCLECWDVTHQAPIFTTHLKEPLTHSEMFAPPKCIQHPNNDLEFFSTEEEVGVCQVCLLKGDFVGKPYCLVSDVRRARQHEIEKGVRIVIEEKERLLVGRQRMEQTEELLLKKLEQQKDSVKANFASIRAALDKRESEVIAALEELKVTKQHVLEQQIVQTDHILNVINDGIRNVKLILNHSNDLELVYLTIVLQEFVADLSDLQVKFQEPNRPISYFHQAAVDSELPVILSSKVADLVSGYAPVPTAVFEPAVAANPAKEGIELSGTAAGKLRLEQPKINKQQLEILKEVGVEEKADEYGCSMM